ncbi:MAG: hypothetical protein K0R61_4048 [Microvirga sp.]|jgi:hypothetical protein|nr:hypothetical protein [Microvirga sp.]
MTKGVTSRLAVQEEVVFVGAVYCAVFDGCGALS